VSGEIVLTHEELENQLDSNLFCYIHKKAYISTIQLSVANENNEFIPIC
jgi:hypothetical protein